MGEKSEHESRHKNTYFGIDFWAEKCDFRAIWRLVWALLIVFGGNEEKKAIMACFCVQRK